MIVFVQEIFNNFVSGTANIYTDTGIASLLGSVDRLSFGLKVLGVTGTSPTITCQLESSADGARWQNQQATPELSAQSLNAGDNFTFLFNNTLGNPVANLVRMRIALGGTTPQGVVRIVASGSSNSDT
jgi:hypothetical protein